MLQNIRVLCFTSMVLLLSGLSPTYAAEESVKSGKTQVVAKYGSREITISDLRTEMARIGISLNQPDAERLALNSLISRIALVSAANKAKFNRHPEAVRRMSVARDQALADFYLSSVTIPAEPTRTEIEDFVSENKDLYHARREYSFLILAVGNQAIDVETVTDTFDETKDFSELSALLESRNIDFSISDTVQPTDSFPKAIRVQLAKYSVGDNIVIKGLDQTQIMKIVDTKRAPIPSADVMRLARVRLMREKAQGKATSLIEDLKAATKIQYFHASVAPKKQQ